MTRNTTGALEGADREPLGSVPLATVVAALEALEAGNQYEATEILLNALEDGPTERPYPCRFGCGLMFEWPGLRDGHESRCQWDASRELADAA